MFSDDFLTGHKNAAAGTFGHLIHFTIHLLGDLPGLIVLPIHMVKGLMRCTIRLLGDGFLAFSEELKNRQFGFPYSNLVTARGRLRAIPPFSSLSA